MIVNRQVNSSESPSKPPSFVVEMFPFHKTTPISDVSHCSYRVDNRREIVSVFRLNYGVPSGDGDTVYI